MEGPTSTHSKVTNNFGAKLPIDHDKIKSCASRFVDAIHFVPKPPSIYIVELPRDS